MKLHRTPTTIAEVDRIPASASAYIRDERRPDRFLVNRTVFRDPGLLAEEWEKVFSVCWLYVGHETEIPNPGDFVTRRVGGRGIIMTRDQSGAVRVWLNACTHRGAEVCRDLRGNTRRFRCFYHSWSFSTDGNLVSLPEEDSYPPGFDKADHGLEAPANVDSYRGLVFLNYDPAAMSLDDYLADAKFYLDLTCDQSPQGMMVTRGTHEYSIKANWKLLMENSADGYHAVPVHKTYLDAQRKRGDDIMGSNKDFRESHAFELGNGHAVTVKQAPWPRPVARWKPSLGADTREIVEAAGRRLQAVYGAERAGLISNLDFNMLIFPNLVINNIMAVIIRKMDPVGPGEMKVTAWSLAPQDEDRASRRVRNDAFLSFLGPAGLATPDDNEALESCQRAFENYTGTKWNDASRGMGKVDQSSYDELQQRTFWRRWQALMLGEAKGNLDA